MSRSLSGENDQSARDFSVITAYLIDRAGVATAVIPNDCPLRSCGDRPCDIRIKDYRRRKTGPKFPLTVVKCHTHPVRYFTLYPPGYAPYQRQPVLALAPDGTRPVREAKSPAGLEAFEGTLFEAALMARERVAWARNSHTEIPDRWWSTQGRHLRLASKLLGISENLSDRVREAISEVLGVGQLILRELSKKTTCGYLKLGEAIWEVLSLVRQSSSLALRLLFSGHLVGKWPMPWKWDPRREILERLPFARPELRAPT